MFLSNYPYPYVTTYVVPPQASLPSEDDQPAGRVSRSNTGHAVTPHNAQTAQTTGDG